jgi:hypothetical protein
VNFPFFLDWVTYTQFGNDIPNLAENKPIGAIVFSFDILEKMSIFCISTK